MKSVYPAANPIDAHLVADLLEHEDIRAIVRGADLAGAVGELPAIGLIEVCVADEDAPRARELVAAWERLRAAPEPGEETSAPKPGSKSGWRFVAGLALGVVVSVRSSGIAPCDVSGLVRGTFCGICFALAPYAGAATAPATSMERMILRMVLPPAVTSTLSDRVVIGPEPARPRRIRSGNFHANRTRLEHAPARRYAARFGDQEPS